MDRCKLVMAVILALLNVGVHHQRQGDNRQ
jgi:hypothetical protein